MKPFSTYDPTLLSREYWNGHMSKKTGLPTDNKFAVMFERAKVNDAYILKAGKSLGPDLYILKPGEWIILPHGFFIISGVGLPYGELFELTINVGKQMGIGNKIPSNSYGLNG